MPDNASAHIGTEMLLAKLLNRYKLTVSGTTSSHTLAWATQCLAAWLSTGGSTTSPEGRVLLRVMEEEVRHLKRRNDEQDRRQRQPIVWAKKLTVRARAPAQMPEATFKMLRRVGFRYDSEEGTWSAWDDATTRAAAEGLAEQGQLW